MLYEWRLVGPQGDVARCSNGTGVVLDAGLDEVPGMNGLPTARGDQWVIGVWTGRRRPVLNRPPPERAGATLGAVWQTAPRVAPARSCRRSQFSTGFVAAFCTSRPPQTINAVFFD